MSETVPADVADRVRAAARDRCGYRLSPQRLVMARLEIEHIVPRSKGGSNDESNLWLSCPLCNRFKSDQTQWRDSLTQQLAPLFNPRTQRWSEHFQWAADGLRIVGNSRQTDPARKLHHRCATITCCIVGSRFEHALRVKPEAENICSYSANV